MNESDQKSCLEALNEFTSTKYKNKNYLFLEPVDPAFVPGYGAIVTNPMDLGTVRTKLESRQYTSKAAFFADVELVFNNAILFHHGRKETAHVLRFAKDMLKLVNREKKKRNNATAKGSGGAGLKLKLSGPSSTSAPPKPKIKLKAPTAPPAAAAAPPQVTAKPKLKLSLSLGKNKTSSTSTSVKSTTAASTNKKSTKSQPKSLPKSQTAKTVKTAAAAAVTASATAAQPAKIRINMGGSRGKELPEGVTPKPSTTTSTTASAKTTTTKAATTKTAKAKKPKAQPKPKGKKAPPPATASKNMTHLKRSACRKVLSGLRRRHYKEIGWFTQPVSDKAIVDDYKAKIKNPMDLGTMTAKLDKNQYASLKDFALDLRRVYSNCLRYNTTKNDSFRPLAVQMLKTAEELMAHFLWKPEAPAEVYPPLLYCWDLCVGLLDRLLNVTNPTDGHQTAYYFLHPASFYFGGSFPEDYLAKISTPVDFGTITTKLIEGTYQSVADFCSDCRLVITNCLTYNKNDGNGKLSGLAIQLRDLMKQQLDALTRYDQSNTGQQARASIVSWKNVSFPKPPKYLLSSILSDLRALQHTDRLTKISQPAMRPFEKPVDLAMYSDYLQFVETPMDLSTVERKVKAGVYQTPEDFEYDIQLIFRNCEAYNAPKKTDQMVVMGKFGAKEFKKLFGKRMRAHENPEEAVVATQGTKRASTPPAGSKSAKRLKLDASAADTSKAQPRAPTPRISITANSAAEAVAAAQKAKMKATGGRRKEGDAGRLANQPVPLHIAIAEVKSRYPLKRQIKFLDEWETACAKFFKELMKHPWISAARPKFIYHVPVPVIFPELKQAYQAKVKKPMDLTSAEAKLLQGGIYYNPQDFVDDIALVFANAITFNKAGRDEGDHLSIAYFDASIHLLKYARWLSLEHLQKYLSDDPHPDEATPDGLPPSNWKLSAANRSKAHEEMKAAVFKEPIDKSIEFDRFPATWHESELEKLLKSLRHQSDFRHMRYYIGPNYPPDYLSYIAKSMDWECVQKTLKRRQYAKFGDVVADLRLIFSNALKYNGRTKDFDEVSQKAYESAIYMSEKLETAIDKMMISVSERMGREKVDYAMEERETDAAERAEEARMRQAMIDRGEDPNAKDTAKTETVEAVRVVQRKQQQRREIDMELSFLNEDEGGSNRQQSDNIAEARATAERQKESRTSLQKLSASIGALVYSRFDVCEQAKKWAGATEGHKQSEKDLETVETPKGEAGVETQPSLLGSSVADELKKAGRQQINMKFQPALQMRKKRKRPARPGITLE